MRLMYDSTNGHDIPRHAEMVAGYVDGNYVWGDDEWNRFPSAVKVRVAVYPSTNDGHALDVEPGNAGPADFAVGQWVINRRAVGIEPAIYCPASWWAAIRNSFNVWGIAQPQYWIARWDSRAALIDGAVAHQYKHGDINLGELHYSGGHYDLSVVADFWPGVDGSNPPTSGAPSVPPTDEGWEYYVVVSGDNLSSIASRFNTTWQFLQRINAITDADLIYPGQRLKVRESGGTPAPVPVDRGYYVIQSGDTLSALAQRWGTTVTAIAGLNGISNPNLIFAGATIRIPA